MNNRNLYPKIITLICCISIYCICSCTHHKNSVEQVLELAGENGKELEAVLQYYQNEPIKQQAACFLIANMPHHYSYESTQIDSMKSIKEQSIKGGKLHDSIVSHWKFYNYKSSFKKYDIQHITAELLIENIDYAFNAWESRPWNKRYSFNDFCKYVLPYRIGDETLSPWRKIYYQKYSKILDSLYNGSDVVVAAKILASYLKQEGFITREDLPLPHLGANFLFKNRIGSCLDQCDVAIYAFRAAGIPIALDFYKISPSYNSTHYWTSIIDTTHLAIPFNYTEKEISRQDKFERKLGKVYRISYDYQQNANPNDNNYFAFFNQPYVSDVTYEYFPNTHAYIRSKEKTTKRAPLYLSVFDGKNYTPITFAYSEGKDFAFPFLEENLVYFPTIIKHNTLQPSNVPFLLMNNIPHYFIPDKRTLITAKLIRKYPILKGRDFIKNTIGVQIWGYSYKEDKDSILLSHFTQAPQNNYITIPLNSKKALRYIKYIAPIDKRIELGEFYVLCNNDTLFPHKITSSHPLDEIHKKDLQLLSDGIWDSFYMSSTKGEQLIFDFRKAQKMTKLIIIPRNDDNYIHKGDTYELFYHNGTRNWQSLGKRTATSSYLTFNNIPSNSILWLHNLTRGKEERPFYITKGLQVFP